MAKEKKEIEQLLLDIASTSSDKDIDEVSPTQESPESLLEHKEESLATSKNDSHEERKRKVILREKRDEQPPKITAAALKAQKGIQNLQERLKLFGVLKVLFGIQMVFMNIIVLLIVAGSFLDLPFTNDLSDDTLKILIGFVKYYITAVLVELLGAIVFVVHNVFSDKTIDKLK